MRSFPISIALSAACVLAGCSGREEKDDAITVTGEGANVVAPPLVAPAEERGQDFVATVAGALRFEIDSAQMVANKGARPDVRQYAQALATAFESSSRELATLAGQSRLKTDPAAGATHLSDLAILGSTQGSPLERAFLEQQLASLMELLGLLRAYKNGGDNDALKGWADRTQAIVADQLDKAQTLRAVVEEAANAGS